jgi:hypothetical protein
MSATGGDYDACRPLSGPTVEQRRLATGGGSSLAEKETCLPLLMLLLRIFLIVLLIPGLLLFMHTISGEPVLRILDLNFSIPDPGSKKISDPHKKNVRIFNP